MPDVADTLVTRYVLDDKYSAGARRAAQATDQFANSARKARNATGKSSGGLMGSLSDLGSGFGKIKSSIMAVTATIGAFVAAGVGVVDFGMKAMEAFSQYDTVERIFRGIYGNAKDAKSMMAYLNVEAQKGNFTFKALAESASKLVMSGMKFSDYNKSIQSIALRMGGGDDKLAETANILLRLKGGGFGEGFQRLKESGIGVEEMERLGATFDKSGQFTGNVEQALALFQKIGQSSKGISDAMEGGSMAMLSNIKESFTRVLASAGEGIYNATKQGIGNLVGALNDAIDSGAIKEAFQGIVELFTADAEEFSLTKVIASVLAGVQTAAAAVKMVWQTIKSFFDSPLGKALIFLTTGSFKMGALYQAYGEDLGKIYENSYNTNLARMDRFRDKKAKSAAPAEPNNPKASAPAASPLAQIAQNTKQTADNTKKAVDMSRHVLGGGDLGRVGLTGTELDAIHGVGAGGGTVKVEVVGTAFDALMSDLLTKYTKQLRQQGALR